MTESPVSFLEAMHEVIDHLSLYKTINTVDDATTNELPQFELEHLIKNLYEEFDSLDICDDIPKSSPTNYMDLVLNCYKLVNVHRKLIKQFQEVKVTNTMFKNQNIQHQKRIDELENTILTKINTIELLDGKLALIKLEQEDLLKDKQRLQVDLQNYNLMIDKKQKQHEAKIKRLERDNQTIRHEDALKNGCSSKSQDEILTGVLLKYKLNEEHYKDTIKQLQDNNRGLISELITLLNDKNTSFS